jgi:hypothetical protein
MGKDVPSASRLVLTTRLGYVLNPRHVERVCLDGEETLSVPGSARWRVLAYMREPSEVPAHVLFGWTADEDAARKAFRAAAELITYG